jgi:chromosome segregation ATPase
MQKALLELKLATVAARRAEVPAVARRDAADAALRAEMQQLEARLAARLEEDEKSVAERLQTASALHALRTEFVALKAELAAAEQGVQADAARHTALEHRIDTLEAKLAADVQKFETDIKAQAAVTESVRASLAQADDLVERVVDAMETIQDSILD